MRKFLRRTGILSLLLALLSSAAQAMPPTLTWLGHAAFAYTTTKGQVFLIDPWLSNPKAPKGYVPKNVVAILLTHGHFDHVGEAFELAKKFNAPIVASFELTEIAKKKGISNVLPLNPSGSVSVQGVTITAVPAVHSSSYQDGEHQLYAGAALGFILEEYGVGSFYDAGDTGVFLDMGLLPQMYHPSFALLPIGGVYTMKPAEAAQAARLLAVRTIIPMHYGTFPALTGTPAELEKEMKLLGLNNRVVTLPIGQAVPVSRL